MARRTFKVVLIKPSHYDADGYVIQWYRSFIPSNSLASVHGLIAECAAEKALGPDVDIVIEASDECNTTIDIKRAIRSIRAAGSGFVGLIGVQSNQFPRALDLGRQFRAAGLTVVMGGFHVSGCLAMLRELPADLKQALDLGITLYAGEAEGRMSELLRDIDAGTLKPVYNYMSDLPEMAAATMPILPRHLVTRVAGHYSSFDAGRGCPFQCSFCTIINVQGRKSRYRTADDVEGIVRANAAQGITRFFITDDNFARNKNWEPILDRLIALRENEGFNIRLLLQVDTLCHRIPGFIEKAARAGCRTVFIGLENINPDNLLAAKKRQNKITDYREMLQKWREHGAITYAGYILGFPGDSKETILRDIEIIKRELPVDILEFFILTPLPGSEDHKTLLQKGVWMDADVNKYDLNHRVSHHGKMSDREWEEAYRAAWKAFYTPEHVRTILRRTAAHPLGRTETTLSTILWFLLMILYEGVHPLEGGAVRLKFRRDRRHGLPIESRFVFYPRYLKETAAKLWGYWSVYRRARQTMKEVLAAPDRWTYSDLAIAPPREDAFEALDLYHATSGGEAALARKRREEAIRAQAAAARHEPAAAGAAP